jgi:DUF1680 family protein
MSNQRLPKSILVNTTTSKFASIKPLPLTSLKLEDGFWKPRLEKLGTVTLPSQFDHLENTGRLDNFRRAAGTGGLPFQGWYFNDSDVYKWLEAASWFLAVNPDGDLRSKVDSIINLIEGAAEPDGYINTYFMFDKASQRWTNLTDMHELYCAGHLIQAAIANHRSTGSNRLLNIAIRFADHIGELFGPPEIGKRGGTGGHPEIEMALVELSRETGNGKYLEQANYFLNARGKGVLSGEEYCQDHKPFRDMDILVGHAVRACYLAVGAADIYLESGERILKDVLEGLWETAVYCQTYISGGIGSHHQGESIGKPYQLPNMRSYTETCAAIANLMWSWRMFLAEGQAKYMDMIETTLYNGVLAALGLDGDQYYYVNPLADDGTHRRQPWFACACCPPNLARLFASIQNYFYSLSDNQVWVNLYAQGTANIRLSSGQIMKLVQRTNYPWNGEVEIQVEGSGEFGLMLRIPGWCSNNVTIDVNDQAVTSQINRGEYFKLQRSWEVGDRININLPMRVRLMGCHPYVDENVNRVALMRGPLLYCVEQVDHQGFDIRDLRVPPHTEFSLSKIPTLGESIMAIQFKAQVNTINHGWERVLYRPYPETRENKPRKTIHATAVPYYAWANREPGRMQVWLQTTTS